MLYTICLVVIFSQKLAGNERNHPTLSEVAILYESLNKIEITFDAATYLQNKLTNKQLKHLLAKKTSELNFQDSLELAKFYFAVEDLTSAAKFAEELILSVKFGQLKTNQKFELNFLLAESLVQLGKTDEAIQVYKTIAASDDALKVPSISAVALARLINLFAAKAQFNDALLFLNAADTSYINNNNDPFTTAFKLEQIRIYSINEADKANLLLKQLWTQSEQLSCLSKTKIFAVAIMTHQVDPIVREIHDSCLSCLPSLEPVTASIANQLLALYYFQFSGEKNALYSAYANHQFSELRKIKHEFLDSLSYFDDDIQVFEARNKTRIRNIILISWLVSAIIFIAFIWLIFKTIRSGKLENLSLNKRESRLDQDIKSIQKKITIGEDTLDSRIADRIETIKNELNERKRIDFELKDALENAEKANYLKNAFLANMSHEIRTPLNGILGFASLLENELALLDTPELYEYANAIEKSGERLLHLLNNIIDISRLEANDIPLKAEQIEVTEVIQQSIENYRFRANEKGIKIVSHLIDSSIEADKQTFGRLISEIVDNAVKYTEKGFIKIVAECDLADEQCIIKIQDTGIGIDQDYLPHIFEAFRQESLGYTRQYQGAGLGLPLAKRLCQKMGGKLEIRSEKAVGTTVEIRFPLQSALKNETKTSLNEETITTPARLLNIFIVEDDAASRSILTRMLNKYATSYVASDGDEAIQLAGKLIAEDIKPDVFLFDINLPAPWDGIKLMKHFKTLYTEFGNTPFIAQTAYAMAGDEEKILEEGFDAYLSKPVQKESLLKTIFQKIK